MNSRFTGDKISYLLGAVFLASGAALVVYVVSGVSLALAALLMIAVGGAWSFWHYRRLPPTGRSVYRRKLRLGLQAGIIATLCYDVIRLVLVHVFHYHFWPFDIFSVFGKALIGQQYEGWWVSTLGFCYHVANGVGFATAYVFWPFRKNIWTGILWAFVLEGFMVAIYPGWIKIKWMDEFLQISILGHIAYGTALGTFVKRKWQTP